MVEWILEGERWNEQCLYSGHSGNMISVRLIFGTESLWGSCDCSFSSHSTPPWRNYHVAANVGGVQMTLANLHPRWDPSLRCIQCTTKKDSLWQLTGEGWKLIVTKEIFARSRLIGENYARLTETQEKREEFKTINSEGCSMFSRTNEWNSRLLS